MAAGQPEQSPRRIAVILGAGGTERRLLELVIPLLAVDPRIEMQGVFLEEAEIRHAAELPFVQELCRVTFSVREFTSDQFEHALALRMRTARRALSVLARRTGVAHSFLNVRGPGVRLLREAASAADITLFEPARIRAATMATHTGQRPPPRIAVVIEEAESGRRALVAAAHLADGKLDRLTLLVAPSVPAEALVPDKLPAVLRRGPLGRMRPLPAGGVRALVDAINAENVGLLVIGATDNLLQPAILQALRERLRCPICLVRRWGEEPDSPAG
jgi:hypothetical protein